MSATDVMIVPKVGLAAFNWMMAKTRTNAGISFQSTLRLWSACSTGNGSAAVTITVSGGVITAFGTSMATAGTSGIWPKNSTFNVMVTGGGGSGGLATVTTDATGTISSVSATPAAGGTGYSAGSAVISAPNANTVLGDLTEVSLSGYTAQNLATPVDNGIDANGYDLVTFNAVTFTAASSTVVVQGYFEMGKDASSANQVLSIVRWAAPQTLSSTSPISFMPGDRTGEMDPYS